MRKIPTRLAMVAAVTPLQLLAAPAVGIHVGMDLPPGPDNPRNSEGAFLPLRDGRILFAYSRYYGDSSNDNAPADIAARYSSDNGRTWTTNDEIIVREPRSLSLYAPKTI